MLLPGTEHRSPPMARNSPNSFHHSVHLCTDYTSPSAVCTRCCCQAPLWCFSPDACTTSLEPAPLTASVKQNTVQTVYFNNMTLITRYLTEMIRRCDDSRLQSSVHGNFVISCTRLHLTYNAFSIAGPRAWNALPSNILVEICLFHMVLRYWPTIILFCHNTRIWHTDGETELQQLYRALHYMQLHDKNGWQIATYILFSPRTICI